MTELKFIYFEDCPNAAKVRKNLVDAGYDFEAVNQNRLAAGNSLKNYSSPTILKENKIIFGSATGSEGGCSLEIPTVQEIKARLGCAVTSNSGDKK